MTPWEPTWKQRTHATHGRHLDLYRGQSLTEAFIGDSMMERWLTTGSRLWQRYYSNCANLGVGGDGIQHLLYRLVGTEDVESILDVMTADTIYLMIGTNNLSAVADALPKQLQRSSVADIVAGILMVINIILEKQPKAHLVVYGLLHRYDVDTSTVDDINARLSSSIDAMGSPRVTYRFFGDAVHHDDAFYDDDVHLSALGYQAWCDDLHA